MDQIFIITIPVKKNKNLKAPKDIYNAGQENKIPMNKASGER